jgi:RNA-binding protein
MLTERQKKFLRGRAHALDPVVIIGNAGLTAGVIAETARALSDHELIKVRVRAADREARDRMIAELCSATASERVHRIGHVATLYRQRPEEPRMALPDA